MLLYAPSTKVFKAGKGWATMREYNLLDHNDRYK
jgi:hypothetical protein